MKNKKNKRLITLLLPLLLLSGVSAVTGVYAYWNMLTKTQEETVQVGEGVAVEVNAVAVAPAGKGLVPDGTLTNSNTQVEEVILTYNIRFNKTVTETFTLSVVASNEKIGGATTYASLVNIVTPDETQIGNAGAVVSVKVTLTEPADEATYNLIINKPITFTLTFTTALAA